MGSQATGRDRSWLADDGAGGNGASRGWPALVVSGGSW